VLRTGVRKGKGREAPNKDAKLVREGLNLEGLFESQGLPYCLSIFPGTAIDLRQISTHEMYF